MAHISALKSLCDITNNLQDYHLEAIHLINSEQNKKCMPTALVFWNVLHNLTCNSKCIEFVQCTKIKFAKLGYKDLIFYSLPNNVAPTGNLELLLAFSWLIINNIIEQKMDTIILNKLSLNVTSNENVSIMTEHVEDDDKYKFHHLLLKAGKLHHFYYSYQYFYDKRKTLYSEVEKKLGEKAPYSKLIATSHNNGQINFSNEYFAINCLISSYIQWKPQENKYIQWIRTAVKNNQELRRKRVTSSNLTETNRLFSEDSSIFNIKTEGEKSPEGGCSPESNVNDNQWNLSYYIKCIMNVLYKLGMAVVS